MDRPALQRLLTDGAPGGDVSSNKVFLLTLARAFRWKDLLESGQFPIIKALADAVGVERSNLAKSLNLTLLSPETVEALAAGDEPDGLLVRTLREGVPARWDRQESAL